MGAAVGWMNTVAPMSGRNVFTAMRTASNFIFEENEKDDEENYPHPASIVTVVSDAEWEDKKQNANDVSHFDGDSSRSVLFNKIIFHLRTYRH
jgi:hypothetical protein